MRIALTVVFVIALSPLARSGLVLTGESQRESSGSTLISSSNAGSTPNTGLNINNLVGANRFYTAGYTGTRSILGIVEAGHVWHQHETLAHATRQFDARPTYLANSVPSGVLGQFDRHATWVASAAAGRSSTGQYHEQGIAHGAEVWSGAIATNYNGAPFTTGFGFSRGYAFTDPYSQMALTGVAGRTADVINASFGLGGDSNEAAGGNSIFTIVADGMARASRAIFVSSAGNSGAGNRTTRGPANGYNGIAVGALGGDTANPAYGTIASFSSRGAQDYNGPDGFFSSVRAVVDIVAPGQNLTLALYGGTTGGNGGGFDNTLGATDRYTPNTAGTSFSSPIVAGGAALLVDLARDRYASNLANAKDGQVIKAVLLNSATKLDGWNNGQVRGAGGQITTSQALDYTYGAGAMNLDAAFDQYTAGTTDVAGLGGGTVSEIGWDYGVLTENAMNDYFIDTALQGGTTFTATLTWFVGREWIETFSNGNINATDQYFTDLSLELWSVNGGLSDQLIAESDAKFISTEHFSFLLPQTNEYLLRVNWEGERYDFTNNTSQTYALAWNATAVPEPSSFLLVCGAACLLMRNRRRTI